MRSVKSIQQIAEEYEKSQSMLYSKKMRLVRERSVKGSKRTSELKKLDKLNKYK